MKKVFSIISACLIVAIISLLICLSVIKKNVNLNLGMPEAIIIYNKSQTPKKSGGYKSSDEEYNKILETYNNITNLTLFDWLIHSSTLDIMPTQDVNSTYANYNTDIINNNIALEFIFSGDNAQQDVLLRIDGDTKVISFNAILFIIPSNNSYSNIVAYYSLGANKEEGYRNCQPIIFKGRAGKFVDLVESLYK